MTDEKIAAATGPKVPDIVAEVLPGNTVNHGGKRHEPGETFKVEGPTAIALVQAGHVVIVGSELPKGVKRATKKAR